jgi:hypothetical protein
MNIRLDRHGIIERARFIVDLSGCTSTRVFEFIISITNEPECKGDLRLKPNHERSSLMNNLLVVFVDMMFIPVKHRSVHADDCLNN